MFFRHLAWRLITFPPFHRNAFFIPQRCNSTKTTRKRRPEQRRSNKRTKAIDFPPAFARRIKEWLQLLEDESAAQSGALPGDTLQVTLKERDRKPMCGHHLFFSWDKKLSKGEAELLNGFRGREFVALSPKCSMDERECIEGRVVGKDAHFLEIRVKNEANSTFFFQQLDSEWELKLSHWNPYKRLAELLQFPDQLTKCPGYKLLLYAYKIKWEENVKRKIMKDKLGKHNMAKDLNQSQLKAVGAALNAHRPIVAIHGPPGTGKTKVIAEIVSQISRKKRVLVCAPSHKAVDSVMQACARRSLQNFIRLGDLQNEDVLREYHIESKAKDDNEFRQLEEGILRTRLIEDMPDFQENKQRRYSLSSILKDSDKRECRIKQRIATETKVIFCTCTSGQALDFLDKGWFKPDLVIMDEAAQVIECVSWIFLLKAPRCVIAGDHHQLPPFVHSLAKKHRYSSNDPSAKSYSFLEYLEDAFKDEDFFHTLSIQYRSNELIQRWSNNQFYQNKLVANELVKHSHIRDLCMGNDHDGTLPSHEAENSLRSKPLIDDPLVLVDTVKGISDGDWRKVYSFYKLWHPLNFREAQKTTSFSLYNVGEALCAVIHLRALHFVGGLAIDQIACITPYIAQTLKIRDLINVCGPEMPLVGVSSVDAYQGQEREAIVMSFVRNNARGEIGFLKEYRRLNVAITRAKRQFLLIASSEMLRNDPKLWNLFETFGNHGRIVGTDALLPSALAVSDSNKLWTGEEKKRSTEAKTDF